VLGLLLCVAQPSKGQASGDDPSTWDSQTLYARACAACHGPNGEGIAPDAPIYQNFDPPPADLTDPLFNSREPAADWFKVIKYGGARLGLSQQMPAYGQALSDEQIEDLVAYLKTLAGSTRHPQGDLNYPRPIRTIKAFPEDEVLLIGRFEDRPPEEKGDSQRGTLYFAGRFARRWQYEIKATATSFDETESEEEIELGLKWTVLASVERRVLGAVGAELEVPLGSDDESEVFIPYFSLGKALGETILFQSTVRTPLPVDEVGDGEIELSGIFQWVPSPWPRGFMPGLEGIVKTPFDSDQGDTEWSVIPQVLVGLTKGGHVAASLGVEVPGSDQPWDYRVHFFLTWDYADGPFWKGW
jgi:mono/diheme cytochrome c family protein